MSKGLQIGTDGFTLPLDLATGSIGILAIKGSGKTYTSAVLTEELIGKGVPVIMIDPTGVHWGLKSSADGRAEGFPVTVFGGDHADLPLEEGAGEVLARWAVERRFCAILDLSHFRKAQLYRFLTPFLLELFRLNRQPMHLVADEADLYCPQKVSGETAKCVGALEDIVRRGRAKGIGTTLISQRPASLNKDVLTQCDVLVALRISHPRDIAPVKEWIDLHGDRDTAKEMIESLPGLPTGNAWVWAPRADIFERITVRRRKTFDSSVTPKIGQVRVEPKVFAKIDLEALGAEISSTVQRAKENDPAALKSEIRKLKSELEKKVPAGPAVERIVEKPIVSEEAIASIKDIRKGVYSFNQLLETIAENLSAAVKKCVPHRPTPSIPVIRERIVLRPGRIPELMPDSNGTIPKGERAILTACAQYPDGASREQLTILTGYKRSSRDTYVQRLRERGLLDASGDALVATNFGIDALGKDFEPLPTGGLLLHYWMTRLPEGEKRILQVLCDFYPEPVSRETIDEKTGYKRSSRDTYLQRLGARRLVDASRGSVSPSPLLFD